MDEVVVGDEVHGASTGDEEPPVDLPRQTLRTGPRVLRLPRLSSGEVVGRDRCRPRRRGGRAREREPAGGVVGVDHRLRTGLREVVAAAVAAALHHLRDRPRRLLRMRAGERDRAALPGEPALQKRGRALRHVHRRNPVGLRRRGEHLQDPLARPRPTGRVGEVRRLHDARLHEGEDRLRRRGGLHARLQYGRRVLQLLGAQCDVAAVPGLDAQASDPEPRRFPRPDRVRRQRLRGQRPGGATLRGDGLDAIHFGAHVDQVRELVQDLAEHQFDELRARDLRAARGQGASVGHEQRDDLVVEGQRQDVEGVVHERCFHEAHLDAVDRDLHGVVEDAAVEDLQVLVDHVEGDLRRGGVAVGQRVDCAAGAAAALVGDDAGHVHGDALGAELSLEGELPDGDIDRARVVRVGDELALRRLGDDLKRRRRHVTPPIIALRMYFRVVRATTCPSMWTLMCSWTCWTALACGGVIAGGRPRIPVIRWCAGWV